MAETVLLSRTPETQSTSDFIKVIAERSRRLRQDADDARLMSLHATAHLGLTLACIAASESEQEERIRYTVRARNSYESAIFFSERLRCTPGEAKQLASQLRMLKDALAELENRGSG